MAGAFQNNPWSYNPYASFAALGSGIGTPGSFVSPQGIYGQPAPFGSQQIQVAQLIQHVQQLAQILPQQLQQLQQTIQFLPQHVAQLVTQALIQSQATMPSFGQTNSALPLQAWPTASSPFIGSQPGAVM